MGGSSSSNSKSTQEFVKKTVLETLSEKNITNIMNSRIKNEQICSSSSTNTVNIGSGNKISGNHVAIYGKITSDQSATIDLSCLAKADIFVKLENDIASKIISDLKNTTNTDIKNLMDNKLSSELGSMGSVDSNTDTNIKTNDTSENRFVDKINVILQNNLDNENTKLCKSSISNEFNLESNKKIQGDSTIKVQELEIIQSTAQFTNCVFSDDVKNSIANLIATDLSGKTDNINTTKSENDQKSTTENKGVGGIFKSILDGIGGIFSSAFGLFVVIGVLGAIFLLYMAKGGGNDLVKNYKKGF